MWKITTSVVLGILVIGVIVGVLGSDLMMPAVEARIEVSLNVDSRSQILSAFDSAASMVTTLLIALFGLVAFSIGQTKPFVGGRIEMIFLSMSSFLFVCVELIAFYLGFAARLAMMESFALASDGFDWAIQLLLYQSSTTVVAFAVSITVLVQLYWPRTEILVSPTSALAEERSGRPNGFIEEASSPVP